jgi:type VI secretion system protein ImpL
MLKNADTNNKYTKQGLDSDLIALTAFSAADKDFQITQSLLNNLSYYMNSIAHAYNVDNAAYIAAVKHIQDLNNVNDPFNSLNELSRKLSTPVQNWIQAITQNSWGLLLNRSATYLDFLFTTTVYPEYKTHVKDGYPVFKDASANISTEDFANFFGPQGTMDTFFNYYLKPFVDISHFYWKWEKIDGQTLPISQDRLEMFLRSFLIQKMFFATQENGPAIEFELRPEGISANVSQFTLNIGGQMLQYSKINNEPVQVRWPGPDAGFITMRFDTLDGHHPTLTETGAWAWFRLLDKATVSGTNSAKQFRITFRQDEYTANYLLTAGTLINPYLPNILDKFRLEPNLIEPNASNDHKSN